MRLDGRFFILVVPCLGLRLALADKVFVKPFLGIFVLASIQIR